MKRIIAVTLVLALITPALPALAADSTTETAGTSYSVRQPSRPASSLRESAKQAVSTDTAYGPRSLPRQGSDGVRNQMGGGGGGKAGMIIGLVSAAAGIGLTVYMLKYMKKTTDAASKSPQ